MVGLQAWTRQSLWEQTFTDEQRQWLEDITDHIAGSVSIYSANLQYAPLAQRGGIGRGGIAHPQIGLLVSIWMKQSLSNCP